MPIIKGTMTKKVGNNTNQLYPKTSADIVKYDDNNSVYDKIAALEGAEANQNAFTNIKVGNTIIVANSKQDILELVAGDNVTITPDATDDKITIAATDTKYTAATVAPGKIASSSSQGSSTNYARQDHTHGIDLATGDNDGQIKIAGTNVSVKGLGTAAYKAITDSYSSTGTDAVSGKAVAAAMATLPEPMVFKGSLGTDGTITALPTDGTAAVGDTYKVITAGTYADKLAKVGDTLICLTKTSNTNTWDLIPSGDEPSGTVTSVTLKANSPISIDNTTAITTSGTRTISHANSGATAGTYRSVTINATGHVTSGTNPTTLAGYGITDAAAINHIHNYAGSSSAGGVATSAAKLSLSNTIDGVSFDGSANIIHYSTCSTDAATAVKIVDCIGFVLATGAKIAVKFTVTNTASNPTLNVNATGAKSIRYRGSVITAGYLAANRVYEFVYDGTNYELIGDVNTNTWTALQGATSSAAGTAGYVPAPPSDGYNTKYLRADGTWAIPSTSAPDILYAPTSPDYSFYFSNGGNGNCSTPLSTAVSNYSYIEVVTAEFGCFKSPVINGVCNIRVSGAFSNNAGGIPTLHVYTELWKFSGTTWNRTPVNTSNNIPNYDRRNAHYMIKNGSSVSAYKDIVTNLSAYYDSGYSTSEIGVYRILGYK